MQVRQQCTVAVVHFDKFCACALVSAQGGQLLLHGKSPSDVSIPSWRAQVGAAAGSTVL